MKRKINLPHEKWVRNAFLCLRQITIRENHQLDHCYWTSPACAIPLPTHHLTDIELQELIDITYHCRLGTMTQLRAVMPSSGYL